MRTKKIVLWYQVLPEKGVVPPNAAAIARKDQWLKEISEKVHADKRPTLIELTYRMVNPDTERQNKFFNGPVVEYFAIQNDNQLTGEVASDRLKRYRESILDEVLGYDIELIDRKTRRRKSTADFSNTQAWNDFLEEVRETLFDPSGFEFPDSGAFWELTKEVGYDEARKSNIAKLQDRLKKKGAVS